MQQLTFGRYVRYCSQHQRRVAELTLADIPSSQANSLSGGEKQRVAIARALISDPLIIMGDERTGNLDKRNSEIVFDIFKKLSAESKQTLLIVTHDLGFANSTDTIIQMEDGRIV